MHSQVITLGAARADQNGAFSLTGTIPADFAAGAHTLVVTPGDISVSVPLTVKPASAATDPAPAAVVSSCTAQAVSGATITWGVKQSFRDYVNGPIAKGSSSIGWGAGSGSYNTEE